MAVAASCAHATVETSAHHVNAARVYAVRFIVRFRAPSAQHRFHHMPILGHHVVGSQRILRAAAPIQHVSVDCI
jgi:hypothetical protein